MVVILALLATLGSLDARPQFSDFMINFSAFDNLMNNNFGPNLNYLIERYIQQANSESEAARHAAQVAAAKQRQDLINLFTNTGTIVGGTRVNPPPMAPAAEVPVASAPPPPSAPIATRGITPAGPAGPQTTSQSFSSSSSSSSGSGPGGSWSNNFSTAAASGKDGTYIIITGSDGVPRRYYVPPGAEQPISVQ